jgi:hypothetical protein
MKMKKRALFLSTIGIAAGVLYALGIHGRKHGTADEQSEDLKVSGNARASAADSSGPVERAAPLNRIGNRKAVVTGSEAGPAIDDQGTDQFEASQILNRIRDRAFDGSNEKLALALGRPTDEIEQWTSGNAVIDGDLIMKARALALQRGLEVE